MKNQTMSPEQDEAAPGTAANGAMASGDGLPHDGGAALEESTLLLVTYDLQVNVEAFLQRAEKAAAGIAAAPGLVWKIWGIEPDARSGTSAYLFRNHTNAEDFAAGPVIAALRDGPASRVDVRIAAVDVTLSVLTHAGPVIAERLPNLRSSAN